MLPSDLYHADLLVHKDGNTTRHPAGRFMVRDNKVVHLEDYYGLIGKTVPEGTLDDYSIDQINNPGAHDLSVASHSDISNGLRHDFVKTHPLPNMLPDPPTITDAPAPAPVVRPPSIFHYTRVGHDAPHVLEVHDGKHMLDGNPLTDDETATILDNVRTKAARLRYAKTAPPAVAKMERAFADLRKDDYMGQQGDMGPHEALAHLSSMGNDEKTNSAIAAVRKHLFEDPMVPGLGNKLAYSEFQKQPPPGVHVMGDANFFKPINDNYGHEVGDASIKAIGGAWRDAAAEVGQGKAHRFGGDEFHAHFPTQEHAANFARSLRTKLEAMPAVAGVHRLGMSIGTGNDFRSADKALYEAKKGKTGHTPFTVPHLLSHSLVPGSEGPAPAEVPNQPPVLPPETKAA